MIFLDTIPGTEKIVQEAFSYSPTSAFSFLVGLMVMVIIFLGCAVVFLFRIINKSNIARTEDISKDKAGFIQILMDNKQAITDFRQELKDHARLLSESCERDKDSNTVQRQMLDAIKDLKSKQ